MPSSQQLPDEVKKEVDVEEIVLQSATEDIYTDGSLDPVYHAKAKILNGAIQQIGMGKYQAGFVSSSTKLAS